MKHFKPIRQICLTLISSICLLHSAQAHADFRKALDAYIARDGDTFVKEVRSSVENSNNDGLMVLLSAIIQDDWTSRKISIEDKSSTNIDQSKTFSTFETILNIGQQQELTKLLNAAAAKSSADVQFRIQFIRLLSDKNKKLSPEESASKNDQLASKSRIAATLEAQNHMYSSSKNSNVAYSKDQEEYWMTKAAELGDSDYALLLSLRYLNFPADGISPSQEECLSKNNHQLCFKKDEAKGFYWLQKAIENSYQNNLNLRRTAYQVGNVLRAKFDTKSPDLNQAYLWYLVGLNSPDFAANGGLNDKVFIGALQDMHDSGELKIVAAQLDALWDDKDKRNEMLYPKNITLLPDSILNIKAKDKINKPIFSYIRIANLAYKIDVYSDGKVFLQIDNFMPNSNQDLYMQVQPSKIQEFLTKLKDIGFNEWLLVHSNKVDASYWCDHYHSCRSDESSITIQEGEIDKTVYLGNDKNVPESNKDTELERKISEVYVLVETYFPTQQLRCNLGNACNMTDDKSNNFTQ